MLFENCSMRWLIPQPCIGSSASVLSTRRSSVPRSTSDAVVSGSLATAGFLSGSDRRVHFFLSEVKRSISSDASSTRQARSSPFRLSHPDMHKFLSRVWVHNYSSESAELSESFQLLLMYLLFSAGFG